MITIVDYGLGNVLAFASAYKRMNISVTAARTADELRGATHVILPGVGAFDHAIELLGSLGHAARTRRTWCSKIGAGAGCLRWHADDRCGQ